MLRDDLGCLSDFEKQLTFGRIGESAISKLLLARGHAILPACDIKCSPGKGPRISGQSFNGSEAVAPDFLVLHKHDGACWAEAKTKTVFTWFRKRGTWQTGIDLHHWKQYLAVAKTASLPLWILFLHISSKPDNRDILHCPATCPTGLFGQVAEELERAVDHETLLWGKHGMVYWNQNSLIQIATLEECCKAAGLPMPESPVTPELPLPIQTARPKPAVPQQCEFAILLNNR